ncbi:MAG: hypothetical protein JWN04_501 [Myxococcaceae bacterium]|nr:hypothetical protein [Myxococcaceae bacterium]
MADPSSILRTPDFSMRLIRERVGGRTARTTLLDASIDSPLDAGGQAPSGKLRRAAVALIIRPDGVQGPEVLFIRRAEHPQDPWSGHMAFPGGREEPSDGELLQTALRETREEVSLDLGKLARLLGRLDELPAVARGRRTGLTIAPFVFELTGPAEPQLNGEVAEVVWAPLEPLFQGDRATTFPYDLAGQQLELPAHDVAGRVVWGLTHRMLESLFALLR